MQPYRSPLNVLVVDDNFGSAFMLQELLRHLGHRSRTAGEGEEAIRAAVAERPDAIFMDVHMPGLGGYDAAKRVKTLVPEVLVIAMSGLAIERMKEPSGFVVFDATLPKPFRPEQVQQVLASLFP